MNLNVEAFNSLWLIHDHLINRFPVTQIHCGNYCKVVDYVVNNYDFIFTEQQKRDLIKSVSLRNNVCHFKPIKSADSLMLQELAELITGVVHRKYASF